jgi:hypothetical protein
MSLTGKRETITNPSHKESAANTEQPKISGGKIDSENYHVLWSLLPLFLMILYWVFYMMFQHNAKFTGCINAPVK